MYLAYYRPLADKVANRVEIISELITLLLMYHLLLFTDFVPDPEVRYLVGYPFTGLMVVFIVFQLAMIMLTPLIAIRNRAREWLAKRKKESTEREKSYQLTQKFEKKTTKCTVKSKSPKPFSASLAEISELEEENSESPLKIPKINEEESFESLDSSKLERIEAELTRGKTEKVVIVPRIDISML